MTHEEGEEVEVIGVEDEEEDGDGEENGEAGPEEGSHEEKILKKNDEKSGEKATTERVCPKSAASVIAKKKVCSYLESGVPCFSLSYNHYRSPKG